jgi:hypothetical protein
VRGEKAANDQDKDGWIANATCESHLRIPWIVIDHQQEFHSTVNYLRFSAENAAANQEQLRLKSGFAYLHS